MQFILGNTGYKEGISHQPNNVQLLAHSLDRAARTMRRSSQSLSNLAGLLAGEGGRRSGSGSGNYPGLRGGSGGRGSDRQSLAPSPEPPGLGGGRDEDDP